MDEEMATMAMQVYLGMECRCRNNEQNDVDVPKP